MPEAARAEPSFGGEQAAAATGSQVAVGVPNMIGDTLSGSCAAERFSGVIATTLLHPTFACSRLNIAEDNSPIPRDRFYVQYNHFENITDTSVFGVDRSFPIERYTFGLEKTFFDGLLSAEVRIPFAQELTSNLPLVDVQGASNIPNFNQPVEFGNMSVVTKLLLFRGSTLAVSSGLGLNLPTARDVRIHTRIDDESFPHNPEGIALLQSVGLTPAPIHLQYDTIFRNNTVNLSPFLAGVWAPNKRLFAQGFFQVDVPLNKSEISTVGVVEGTPVPSISRPVEEQTLMRLNAGLGYWLLRNPCARWVTGIAPTVEVHYTTTLEDANIAHASVPISFARPFAVDFDIGNLANRVDVVDLTLGNTLELANRLTVATGFVIPLSQGDNKPFDFEFTLQLNYRF
jgi:hypothetical protein